MQEKAILYLRTLISASLLAIWCFWIVNLPNINHEMSKEVKKQEAEIQKSIEIKSQEAIDKKSDLSQVNNNQNLTHVSKAKPTPVPHKEKQINKVQTLKKADLPRLAKLEIQQTNNKIPQASQKPLSTPQAIKLSLPKIAEATREVLTKESVKQQPPRGITASQEIALREKVYVEKKQDKDDLNISWIPKYIKVKKDLSNLDLVVNQLEVTGLIKRLKGQDAAIIKNKENNMIEILKVGDEYLGLKLSEIRENKIVLKAPMLNKTYTKEVITSVP